MGTLGGAKVKLNRHPSRARVDKSFINATLHFASCGERLRNIHPRWLGYRLQPMAPGLISSLQVRKDVRREGGREGDRQAGRQEVTRNGELRRKMTQFCHINGSSSTLQDAFYAFSLF